MKANQNLLCILRIHFILSLIYKIFFYWRFCADSFCMALLCVSLKLFGADIITNYALWRPWFFCLSAEGVL